MDPEVINSPNLKIATTTPPAPLKETDHKPKSAVFILEGIT